MFCQKRQHVKNNFGLLVICVLLPSILAFTNDISTLNPTIISTSAFCIQDLLRNPSGGIFYNKLTKVLYFTDDGSIVTQITPLSMITFKQITCISRQRVVLLAQNSSIFQYNVTSGAKTSFDSSWAKEINIIKISDTQQKLIYVINESIRIKSFPLTPLSDETSSTINTTISKLKCSIKRNKSLDGYCFLIPTNLSSLLFFHISHPQIIYQRPMTGIKSLAISQLNQRIYVGFETGQIREYSMLNKNTLMFQRSTNISLGYGMLSLVTNQLRGELLYLNSVYKIGILNLTSGYEVGQTTYLSSFNNNLTTISLLSRNSIAVFNPSQNSPTIRLLNTETIIANSITNITMSNPLAKRCPNKLQYYNASIGQCYSCTKGCSMCDEETGQCIKCDEGYFKNGELCLNCKYASITSDFYSLCFQDNEITVLAYTTTITPALTSTIHTTYSLLSSSALLFLFLRFINFWSIISLYYFLNIDEIPFFLLEILSKIFNILYGSVFQFLGIDVSYINMGVKEKSIDQKMIKTKITTDFLAANFQSIVMYIYSLVMICVLYDGIKRWFKKIKVNIFENVKLQACLEEFVGLFITLLVPSYLFIEEPNFGNFYQKLNNSLFMLLLGIGLVFPFFYTLVTLQRVTLKKRIRFIRKSLKKKGIISQSTFKMSQIWGPKKNIKNQQNQTEKRLTKILSQEETQKLLYYLNCFWSPFLVGFKSPIYFLVFGFFNHLLSLWNAFYAKEWKYNLILGKTIFFLYHLSFVLIKIFPTSYFSFSIIAFSLLIAGGFHELLSAVGQKLYFVFLVLKNKGVLKSNKISIEQNSMKNSENENSSVQQKSIHSKISWKEISSQKFQKSSLKNIDTTITNTNIQNSTKKIIKKVKIADKNQNIVKNIFDNKILQAFTWNQEKSLQNIDLTNKQTQQLRNKKAKVKVKFTNVQNIPNKIDQKHSLKIRSQKRQTESQNKNSLVKENFKVTKLNKLQRRVLFDQQFGDFEEQKQNNQRQEQNEKKSKTDKNFVATFSHPTEDNKNKKKVKFLTIDSTRTKLGQFSKTLPQTKISLSIKQT